MREGKRIPATGVIEARDVREILTHGDIDVEGRLISASNTTVRGVASLDGVELLCVYKPRRGERPLWDFPTGTLGHREVAAHLMAESLGWSVIPETVWRDDGPMGDGMCQRWIEEVPEEAPVVVGPFAELRPGWCVVAEGDGEGGERLVLAHDNADDVKLLAILDAILNNSDRKGGHIMRDGKGVLYGIDHGLTFHPEDKMRTVLWGWVDQPLPEHALEDLHRLERRCFGDAAPDLDAIRQHISPHEWEATCERISVLASTGAFPRPSDDWPALPWPAM